MTRITPLEGVHNFRHFHGYDAADGAKVRGGLYRSGHHSRATAADLEIMRKLGIRVVADLRKARERTNEPSAWPEDMAVRVIASDLGDAGEPPHLAFMRKGVHTPEAVRDYMLSAYRRIPMEACNQEVYREGYRALASGEADGGFLVHCAAGKDRTGIFCALILEELGVDRDTVMADYLLTNEAVDFESLIPRIQERSVQQYGQAMPAEIMQVFLGVDADYLAEAFRTMGDTGSYVTGQLGITEAERQALRERWLTS
ncbi:tyrosine-protein phosphatase [Maricaulis virginensis]|uniref:Protein-tyrosine-phosphatase n=1 Tax=Maricaulis virginensis TaxID=144022 RepID=A0A9W6MNK2_9PROT|nr:tyrosine-protein phosphatase [Maricaulis virginensis]GLK51974.1 protein-tyrosine-phosphatase [Maricaulis virginensis]